MTVRVVEVSTSDGVVLRGLRWDGNDDWVVLVHDVGQDLDSWRPVQKALAGRGYTLLALDLRGHGTSDDPWDADMAHLDVEAALTFGRREGAASLCVAAAGFGGIAALLAAAREKPDGMILLSPGPLPSRQAMEGLRGPGIAKLFFVGSQDMTARDTVAELRNASIGWALTVSLPSGEQGTALLTGPWGTHVCEHIVRFLDERRFLARNKGGTRRASRPTQSLPGQLLGP